MEELDYEKSKNYWSKVPASVDGMLGGFSYLTAMDIKGSAVFLRKLFQMENGPSDGRVLDCGAGIGRITEHLLCKHFQCVDLLEQDEKFLNKARQKFQNTNVKNFYCSGKHYITPSDLFSISRIYRSKIVEICWRSNTMCIIIDTTHKHCSFNV